MYHTYRGGGGGGWSSKNRGMRSSSGCSRRSALPGGREWGGRAQPRPKTVHSTGPGHAWIREEMERVEDFCYTYKTKFQKKKKKKKVRMCIRE